MIEINNLAFSYGPKNVLNNISMKLEENDRSSRTRLMKVKDMLLEKAHHYSEKY